MGNHALDCWGLLFGWICAATIAHSQGNAAEVKTLRIPGGNMGRRMGWVLSAALLGGALTVVPVSMAAAEYPECGAEEFSLELAPTSSSFEVSRADGNENAEPGSYAAAVAQANAHPGIDEIVIGPGVLVTGHEAVEALEESTIIRGVDETSGFSGPGVQTAGIGQYFEFRDLQLRQGEQEEVSTPILDLQGSCGNVLTRVNATGIKGTTIRNDGTSVFVIADSQFVNNAASDGYSYGGVVVSDYMANDPVFTIRNTEFLNNSGGVVKVLKPMYFSGVDNAGMSIVDTVFQGNRGYDWDSQYSAGTVTIGGLRTWENPAGPGTLTRPMLTVERSLFENNYALHSGGIRISELGVDPGFAREIPVMSVTDSSFIDNTVNSVENWATMSTDITFGGYGVGDEEFKQLVATNSTFVNGNLAGDITTEEGRIVPNIGSTVVGGDMELSHVTLVGSGIDLGAFRTGPATVKVQNSVLNTAEIDPVRGDLEAGAGLPAVELQEAHAVYTTEPAAIPAGPGRQIATNEQLALGPAAAFGDSTPVLMPALESVLVDAGTASDVATDQRGQVRPVGGAPDVGSVEVMQPTGVGLGAAQEGKPGAELAFTVTRSDAVLNSWRGVASVRVRSVDETAHAGTDYNAVDEVLTWEANDFAPKTVKVQTNALEKSSVVPAEPLTFALQLSEPGDLTAIENGHAVGTLSAGPVDPIIDPPVTPPVQPPEPPVSPQTNLARTGADGFGPLLGVGAFLIAGAAALLIARRRHG